jgi:hypothetical protein
MASRFQIEDMVAQDPSGVVFRAMDLETGLQVAVRRFFPFGAKGGGLSQAEQADYHVAVAHLAGINHPNMRSIIDGGCDPVDGMPYIATEWLDGQPLQILLDQAPVTPAQAAHLLSLAIDVCRHISEVLGEEAVWVETDVQTIIIGADGDGRGITFWLSPLKWLGKSDGQRGLSSLVTLTEDMMGWRGKRILDHDGEGLGAWLKWLRQAPPQTSLYEAGEKLTAAAQGTVPSPTRRMARPPVRPTAPVQRKSQSKLPFFVGSILLLAAISGGGWGLIQWNNARHKVMADSVTMTAPPGESITTAQMPPVAATAPDEATAMAAPPAAPKSRAKTAEQIRLDAAEFNASIQNAERAKANKLAAVAARNGVHHIEDSDLLLERLGDEVVFEGTLDAVERSSKGKGKTIYLMFPGGVVRGGVEIAKAEGDLSESALSGLVGKKLRIKGSVRGDGFGKSKTPVVLVEKRTAIQEIP